MDHEAGKDAVFGNLNRLNQILGHLDERGLVLALAAFAEEALGDLIEAFLIPGDPAKQLLEGFNAPLGTFSARIKMAYSLGLVTKRQHADLDRLRRIRNEFSHNWEPLSFNDQKVADHIRALRFSSLDDDFPASPIEKMRTSLGSLLVELRSTTNQINKRDHRAKLIGQHLIAGVVGELDDQITLCRKRLIELSEELKSSSGERQSFLLQVRHQWKGKLEIVRLNAPRERQNEIRNLQAELNRLYFFLVEPNGRNVTSVVTVDYANPISFGVLVNGETVNTPLYAILKYDFLTKCECKFHVHKKMLN